MFFSLHSDGVEAYTMPVSGVCNCGGAVDTHKSDMNRLLSTPLFCIEFHIVDREGTFGRWEIKNSQYK